MEEVSGVCCDRIPDVLLHRILGLLPSNNRAGSARLVNRAMYQCFKREKVVNIRDPDLPVWLLQQAYQAADLEQRGKLLMYRAALGDLAGVQWLTQQNCPMSAIVCTAAASRGRLSVLQHLRSLNPPCPWDGWTTYAAGAAGKHLDVLDWLLTQRPPCPTDINCTYSSADQQNRVDLLHWLPQHLQYCGDSALCTRAAEAGQVAALRWLQQAGFKVDEYICRRAAKAGQLDVLKDIFQRSLDEAAAFQAAVFAPYGVSYESGRTLPFAGTRLYFDETVYSAAAGEGHLEVVSWLHSYNVNWPVPWGPHVCRTAAARGQLEVLRWLRSQQPPCPWNKQHCWEAAKNHPKARQWIEDAPEC